jgi:hypothetical protein
LIFLSGSLQDVCNLILLSLATSGITDTSSKFTAGVVGTGGKFSTGVTFVNVNLRKDVTTTVFDTGCVAMNIFAIFQKIV